MYIREEVQLDARNTGHKVSGSIFEFAVNITTWLINNTQSIIILFINKIKQRDEWTNNQMYVFQTSEWSKLIDL